MNPPHDITKEMLRSWQERGLTVIEASAESGSSIATIRKYEARLGIRLKRERRPLASDCRRLASDGLTVPEAAAALGVPTKTIRTVAKRKGIVFRETAKRECAPLADKREHQRIARFSCSPAAIERALAQRGMQ